MGSKPNDKSKTPRAKVVVPATNGANPYREGTRKAKAFVIYQKGGTRGEVLAAIKKLNVADNSASSWYYYFGQVVKTGTQNDWEKRRKRKAQASA